MPPVQPPIRIIALYRFATFADCAALQPPLAALCAAQGVKGTLLLAREGINGTIAGSDAGIEAVLEHIRSLPGCADIEVKESRAAEMPFHRMKVRLKREIVTMGEPDIDPLAGVGHYVPPADWNALIEQPDTVVIDTRNDYEVALGSFDRAIDPATRTFRDFPAWFRANRERVTSGATKVAMFCTGGIRCEKATAFLKSEGIDDVYHLQGGILAYLETVPPEQSRWQGECFVFDERVSVGHGLQPGDNALCRACRMPVTPQQRTSPLFVEGVSCPACHAQRTDEQRAGYAERHRQERLAEARGQLHVGAVLGEAEAET
ncbi:oxygen-dependent tRNA uridine(34) hydroxylase TrhO [Sphingomonas qomolangmaensis]|uniref:tRNA uridine(34) hydroxylase n=1 Tax=Sphingomonas qomolangmaensis TaxID=2918765 RepID=A0ABY5LAH4_9SPHN|nr:rhodanese-related sulfurtransferase [Sphingomonas qomolangmaensis]UUL81706.1 rhodanese-related sulfurtransferase [Sphingomonas qomolangmaensis]